MGDKTPSPFAMNNNIIIEQAEQLQQAIEEFNSSISMARSIGGKVGVGIESYGLSAAVEDVAVAQKKNIFRRLLDFFTSMWERLKEWANKRMEKNRKARKAKDVSEDIKEELKVTPEEKKKADFTGPPQQYGERKFNKDATKLIEALTADTLKQLSSREFVNEHCKPLVASFAAMTAIDQDKTELMEVVVRFVNTFRDAVRKLSSAVEQVKNNSATATNHVNSLMDSLEALKTHGQKMLEEARVAAQYEPASIFEILQLASSTRTINLAVTWLEESALDRQLEDIEADLQPLINVFKEFADADTASTDFAGQASPQVLSNIVHAPAQLMAAAGRLDTVRTIVIPNTEINLRAIVAKAVKIASGDKNIIGISDAVRCSVLVQLEAKYG